MSTKKFLHYVSGEQVGLYTLLVELKKKLATKAAVQAVKDNTDSFILSLDYSELAFDVNQIVDNEGSASSSLINTGQVNYMIIANS